MATTGTLPAIVKTLTRHKALFCYIVLLWGCGTLISTALMGSWAWTREYVQQYPDPRQARLKHQPVLPANHPKITRPIKYCNLLSTFEPGHEGQSREDDSLEAVIIVTRHGDRGPLHEFRNQSQVHCGVNPSLHTDLVAFTNHLQAEASRRNTKDPFYQFPLLPSLEQACVPGQLTARGILQMLRLGDLLQEVYLGKWHLLSDPWLSEEIVAYSTPVLRTYQSALAFLYGLLPDFDLNKIQIRPGLGLTYCYSHALCECAILDKLEQQIRKERWKHMMSHPAVQGLVRFLNPFVKAHDSDKDIGWPDDIFDTLMVYLCHGAPLPCVDEGNCATVDHLNSVLAFLDWSGKQIASHGTFRRSSRLKMHGFLTDLAQKLSDVQRGKRKHKIILYSAHDITLIPLMSSFGFFDGTKVPFASRIVVELYSRPPIKFGQDKLFHIKLLYNGKDMTKRLPFCQHARNNKTVHKDPCPLSSFVHYVTHDFFTDFNVTTYKQACTQPTAPPQLDPTDLWGP